MNKEVIKKHKNVYEFWLNGGRVWCKSNSFEGWDYLINPSWVENCIYVQNDEYVELRKALAENKEVIYKYDNRWIDLKEDFQSNKFYNFEWKLKEEVDLTEVSKGEYKIKSKVEIDFNTPVIFYSLEEMKEVNHEYLKDIIYQYETKHVLFPTMIWNSSARYELEHQPLDRTILSEYIDLIRKSVDYKDLKCQS